MGREKDNNEIERQEEYDEIDKYIEKIVTQKIEVPESFEKAMKEALYSEKFYKRLRKRKIKRTIITACASVILTSGVAVGGFVAYEKIWKEPKKYTYNELQNTIANSEVPDEEKAGLISEEDAKKNALEILTNLGYEGEEIKSIELDKNNEEMIGKTYYVIETTNSKGQELNIRINAENGKLEAFEDNKNFDNIENLQNISEEEAKCISFEICKDINYEENDLEIISCVESFQNKGENINIWNTTFQKKYNNVVNPYEKLVIRFWIQNNTTKISSIYTEDNGKYEDNPMVISKEEAITIAQNKEKELTDNIITDIQAEYGIRMMNNYIFNLEEGIDNTNYIHEGEAIINNTERRVRNVWIVKFEHNFNSNSNEELQRIKDKSKMYYVDITTGEIIGGKDGIID